MATAVSQPKSCRLDMRMTAEQRAEIELAAAIKGKKITQWSLDSLLEAARRAIAEESTTRLSPAVFDEFAQALDKGMPAEAKQLIEQKPVWQS